MPISLVLFDMDDVLSHYDRSIRVRRLAELTQRTHEDVVHAIWDSGLEAKADAGLVDEHEYLSETSRLLDHEITVADWLHARREAMSPNHEVIALAAAVARKCRIAVLTNNPRLVETHIAYLSPAIAGLFDGNVYASATFNAAKPSKDVFLKCLGKLAAKPEETLFIDDLPENVAGACGAGLVGHVFRDVSLLSEELQALQLINR